MGRSVPRVLDTQKVDIMVVAINDKQMRWLRLVRVGRARGGANWVKGCLGSSWMRRVSRAEM